MSQPGNGPADGAGLGFRERQGGQLQGGLGLAVALVDGQAQRLLASR